MFPELDDFEIFEDSDLCRNIRNFKVRSNPFEDLDDAEFYSRYRVDKITTKFLIESLNIIEPVSNRGLPFSPELQVLTTLHFFGRNVHQTDVGSLHGISQSAVGKIIRDISKRIASLLPPFIRFPSSTAEFNDVKAGFYNIARFPKVIGAIDCTHIKIKRPGRIVGNVMAGHYINRKGYYSLNVQIVTDYNCKILDIVVRSRGSLHDSNILENCRLKRTLEDSLSSHQGVLLGNAGYPCSNILLTPLRNPASQREERYNNSHTSTRSRIECLNGQLKSKFRALLDRLRVDLGTAKNVIVAVAVLHNIAKERNFAYVCEEDQTFSQSIANESSQESTVTERAFRNAFINRFS